MPKVRMKIHTGYAGKKLSPGDSLAVSDLIAKRWSDAGYAEILPGKKPEKVKRKTVKKPVDEKKVK